MTRIEMGMITDDYKTYMVTEGFDIHYEIIEVDSGITNTFNSLEDFAEEVLMIVYPMGYNRLKNVARKLLMGYAKENRDQAILYCKKELFMEDKEFEFIGGDEL